jgi:hypothetical protein
MCQESDLLGAGLGSSGSLRLAIVIAGVSASTNIVELGFIWCYAMHSFATHGMRVDSTQVTACSAQPGVDAVLMSLFRSVSGSRRVSSETFTALSISALPARTSRG